MRSLQTFSCRSCFVEGILQSTYLQINIIICTKHYLSMNHGFFCFIGHKSFLKVFLH